MTRLDVARRRMRNSRLTDGAFASADEVVRWHGAMQAQEYGLGKWSIGQRTSNVVDEDVDSALTAGSIVRTHVLRPTWHFVAREDLRWLLALTGPRVQKSNGPRYRGLGLDERTLARCAGLIVSALEGGRSLTRAGIAGVLDEAGIDRSGQRLPHILMHCELEGAICSGGLEGKQQTYALLDERIPGDRRFDRDEALVELVRRYLSSHGPATVWDFAWWSSLTIADISKALDMLGSEVGRETVGELPFCSMASDEDRPSSRRGAALLQAYDELLVGYTRSRFFGDPRRRSAREDLAWHESSRPSGVLLMNGAVAGHWRRPVGRDSILLSVILYDDLSKSGVTALEAAARRLGRFLRRNVTVEAST